MTINGEYLGVTYKLETVYEWKDENYRTTLTHEKDYYPNDVVKHFWYVDTERVSDGELVNNTGSLTDYDEAVTNYEWHLDLYYQVTLEQTLKGHA